MKNVSQILDVLTKFRKHHSRRDTLLLATSAYVTFTRRQLWGDLIRHLHLYKNSYSMGVDGLSSQGLINTIQDGSHTNHYELSKKGYDSLPADSLNEIQLLVDASSEEVNHPDDQSSCSVEGSGSLVPEEQDETQQKIIDKCLYLERTLLKKNESYGNSSLKPLGIFPIDRRTKIQARMEDKISRLRQVSRGSDKEALKDTLLDLAGYSILHLIELEEE